MKRGFSSPSHRPASLSLPLARSTHSTPPPTPPWPVPGCNPRSVAGWSELECARFGEARRDGMACGGWACGRSGHGTLYQHTAKEEAVKECASSHLIIGGSYRQLSEFGLRKSAARGAAMSCWLLGDDVVRERLLLEARSRALESPAMPRQTANRRRQQYSSVYST